MLIYSNNLLISLVRHFTVATKQDDTVSTDFTDLLEELQNTLQLVGEQMIDSIELTFSMGILAQRVYGLLYNGYLSLTHLCIQRHNTSVYSIFLY